MSVKAAEYRDERAEIDALLRVAERADGYPPLTEDAWIDYLSGPARPGLVARDGAFIVGYAHVRRVEEGVVVEPVIHPECRSTMARRLLAATLERIRPEGVLLWASDPDVVAAAAALGLAEDRSLLHLTAPLPVSEEPAVPPGVDVDTFRVGRDEAAVLEVNAAAFARHPDNAGWGLADLEARIRREWFDPEGFFLARRAGELVAGCWTKLHPGGIGEIYWIGVHPEAQRTGLGRALTLIGLEHLAGTRHTATLYTESSNAPALGLYESLGFRTLRVKRLLRG